MVPIVARRGPCCWSTGAVHPHCRNERLTVVVVYSVAMTLTAALVGTSALLEATPSGTMHTGMVMTA